LDPYQKRLEVSAVMHIVGIIGPYFSGGNRRLIDINIANAQYVMVVLADHFGENQLVGFFAPHSHTARFERLAQAPESYYHTLDDALYDRACEGFILLPDWKNSRGARRDHRRAVEQGKHVFCLKSYSDEDMNLLLRSLQEWARQLNES
jgi:hypothetical protein